MLLGAGGEGWGAVHPSGVSAHVGMCFVVSLAQITLAILYMLASSTPFTFPAAHNPWDFLSKFLCCVLLHLVISMDLQKSVEVQRYLQKPTNPNHIVRG